MRVESACRRFGTTLGLAYLSVAGANPVDHIEAAAAAGFAAVGLRLIAPGDLALEHDVVGDPGLQRATVDALARTGVRVLDAEVFGLAAPTDVGSLLPALDVAARLGVAIVQVVVEDAERQRAADRFCRLCEAAAQRQLAVAVEFMRWRALRTLQDADAFVRAAAQPNASLCIDTLHLSRCGNAPADLGAVTSPIGYVQLSDAAATAPPADAIVAEARGGRRYPGEGELPLHELLDAVVPGTPLSVEVARAANLGRSARDLAGAAAEAMDRFMAAREGRR
jgi:sugar phosphate isomerase/epimerase